MVLVATLIIEGLRHVIRNVELRTLFAIGIAQILQAVFIAKQANAYYMIPSFKDIPDLLTSETISEEEGEFHGIGEMTLPPVAPAIANAIYDATGVRITDLPITAERVLRGLSQ